MKLKLPNGIEVIELMPQRMRVRMKMPFGGSYAVKDLAPEVVAEMASLAAQRSLQEEGGVGQATFADVNPKDSDYIYPLFRALSADLIDGYFLDFRKKGVLEEAAPLLYGQTVYTNHRYYDVERWVGSVNVSEWDEKGEKVGGKPGINVELKIDWKVSPRIARGLLMKPPAIHSVSATVLFDWDASHPELLEQKRFWALLGEEVDGEIVRIIVTKIQSFWELSLVFQGADTNAKQLPDDDDYDEEDELSVARKRKLTATKSTDTNPHKEKTTVKLTDIRKTALGIQHDGEDVPDEIVLRAVDDLSAKVSNADAVLSAERAEVVRLATIAEADKDGKLPAALQSIIDKADGSQLPGLKSLYTEKAAGKFTKRCQKCGSTEIAERSSVEDNQVVTSQQSASVKDTSLF